MRLAAALTRLVLVASFALTALAAHARADAAPLLDVSALAGGRGLGPVIYVLRDPAGSATLDDVMRADAAGELARPPRSATFGFTRDAVWLRFDAYNPTLRPVRWLLEIGFPHLDHVDLYVVHPGARPTRHVAGDHLPFARRELEHANVLFQQTISPAATVRYYLRAQTAGALRVPLTAWDTKSFIAHDARVSTALWLFYGALLVMSWYNLCIAAVTRSREHAYLSGLLLFMVLSVGALSGHVFEYLLRDQPVLVNRALAVFIALALAFMQLYTRETIRQLVPQPWIVRVYAFTIPSAFLLALLAALTPTEVGQGVLFLGILAFAPLGMVATTEVRRRKDPRLRFTVLSTYTLLLTVPVALLSYANVIPPHPLALWAGHIGCAAYCVIASLALPVRLNTVSGALETLNAQLSSNVDELTLALSRAEHASEEARRATLVKDEFMATMTHELRTPLNAIINVPQGLLEDFPTMRAATCASCGTDFVLEPGEQVDAQTRCPDCHQQGTLRADTITQYVGSPAHTARFLAKIERSGRHLLQMVNGVLDYSKMEAGRMELALEPLDLAKLLRETVDELRDVAKARDIDIELHVADDPKPALGDPMRLKQVTLNLLSNAIKFSGPGTRVDVRWQRDPDNDVISVTDRGIGIAAEDHARVFSSFEQVHKGDTRKYGGTGLGLSVSRSLIRMHGGELWVESELGEGATFTFRVPRLAATITERQDDRSAEHALPEPVARRNLGST